MPETFSFSMSDVEIESIIDYLESPDAAGPSIAAGGETPTPAEATGAPDPTRGQQLAQSSGCTACHSIDGSVIVGPSWKGVYNHQVEFEDGTTGTADDAYLHESIVNPGAKIAKGFQNLMPPNYGDTLTEAEIQDIIAYIKTL